MNWKQLDGLDNITSPGLLVDPDKVQSNIRAMIQTVGGDANRLRPHVKTHKMAQPIRMQVDAGITKFKAATLAEAAMAAGSGGTDVLLAYPMVGPNVARLAGLARIQSTTSFATIVDDPAAVQLLSKMLDVPLRVFIDVDCGMHRTGIQWGPKMDQLRVAIESAANLEFAGLHVYDGHLHQPEIDQRRDAALKIIDEVRQYDQANPSPTIIGGGSPTFPFWAQETDWECSPGTPVFWDAGYGKHYPDLTYQKAVALITRVISKPTDGTRKRLCLDLGYKSVASEMPLESRVIIPAIPDAKLIAHSEEHLIVDTDSVDHIPIGEMLLAFPCHVCPTVALHSFATVVRDGRPTMAGDGWRTEETWKVIARDRYP
ncbi:MAG: alanine racemase [Rubripirellula sp.]